MWIILTINLIIKIDHKIHSWIKLEILFFALEQFYFKFSCMYLFQF